MRPSLAQRASTQPGSRVDTLATVLLTLTAMGAAAGGTALTAWPHGSELAPLTLLQGSGFDTFVVPGTLLALVIGGSSTLAAALRAVGSSYAIDATLFAAGALTLFIVNEIAMMGMLHPLHVIFGSIGVVLLLIGVRAARRSGEPRHRYTVVVTAAEALGFAIPASIGIAVTAAGLGAATSTASIIAAGALEGFLCGFGQASALPVHVHRLRFASATAIGAALCWSLGMALSACAQLGLGMPVTVSLVVVGSALALVTMGAAQWTVLRRHARGRAAWIGFTALAWTLALPFSFAPSPIVDEHTKPAVMATLWTSAGVAMAYVMALVTWQGARRLEASVATPARAGSGNATPAQSRPPIAAPGELSARHAACTARDHDQRDSL